MGRLGGLFALVVFVSCLLSSGLSQAESLTWNVRSEHPNSVALEFYSSDRNAAWPGGDSIYVLDDDQSHSYTLSCESGETICYGAWVQGDEATYWGTGRGGQAGCENCCYVCSGGETPERMLSR